jgi:dTDP-4-amino-4,6-dideoxygalactose transaminase
MLASNYYLPQDKVFFLYKGRVALYALLHEMGIGEGDQVLMPAYTCVVVPNAVLYLGAEPLYTDIELPSFSVTPASVENAVTERTKVVLCQNTYGLSAHVDEIVDLCRKRGIRTIEDCTHGFGGTYKGKPNGSWCDAAFYSSQWNKPFSTGLGGYALVNDPELEPRVAAFADNLPQPSAKTQAMLWILLKVRSLVTPSTYYTMVNAYRWLSKKNLVTGSSSGEEIEGTTMPKDYLLGMSTVQRKAAQKAIKKLPALNALRKANATIFTQYLSEHGLNHVNPKYHNDHLFLKYPLLVKDRNAFFHYAQEAHIPLGDWFISPLHPVMGDLSEWGFDPERYPNAVFAAAHVVNLPTDTHHPDKVIAFLEKHTDLILDQT